jgi:hypothetical protein
MAVSAVLKKRFSHEGTETRRKSVVVMAVPCRFGAHDKSPRIEKNGRGGSPSGPKLQARTRRFFSTQFLAHLYKRQLAMLEPLKKSLLFQAFFG